MKFTEQEIHGSAVMKVRAYLDDRLNKHRIENDKDKSSDETARLRGRIMEIKELQRLVKIAQVDE